MNGRDRRDFTITKLRLEDGVWHARVTINGKGVDVDRRYGSWRITPEREGIPYRDLPCTGEIAQELQRQVRALENARKPKKVTVTNEQAETIKAANPEPYVPLKDATVALDSALTSERFVALG